MRCSGLEVSMAQRESVFARDGYLHQSPEGEVNGLTKAVQRTYSG
jgi:hypothetical protein